MDDSLLYTTHWKMFVPNANDVKAGVVNFGIDI
jgi:hypothetical protein